MNSSTSVDPGATVQATPHGSGFRSPIKLLGGWGWTLLTALVVGFSIALMIRSFQRWSLEDLDAYWNAALRLRSGAPLYSTAHGPDAADVYRYSPWFAVAWVPLTYLPRIVVGIGWGLVLVIASLLAVAPVMQRRRLSSTLAGILFGSMLLWTASRGNVQPLLVLALIRGIPSRSGPLWVALAASLKAVPVLYLLPDAFAGRWRRVTIGVALTAVLIVPMPLLGWRLDAAAAGASDSLYSHFGTAVGAIATVAAFIGAVAVMRVRPQHAWRAASVAAVFALPRLLFYDLTFLLVGSSVSAALSSAPSVEPEPAVE